MAWFAPKEKVHLNTRFSHHRQELAEYLTMRKGLGLNRVKDETPNIQDTTEVLKKLKAEYVAIHSQSSTREILVSQAVTGLLYQVWGEWSAWYQDGRTTVFGWRANSSEGRPSFAGLRLDPTRLAFGAGASKVPDGEMKQPLIPGGWEEAYVRPAKIAPPGSSEAIGWLNYKDGLVNRQRIRQTLSGAFFFYGAPTGNSMHHFSMISLDSRGVLRFPPKHEDSEADVAAMRAIPILAMQAARRAIVADPDHPDGYYALGRTLGDTDLPLTESERAIGMVTAYRQALSRFPAPDKYKRGQFGVAATDVALELTRIYLGRRLEYRDPQSKKPVVFYTGFPVAINEMSEVVGQTILETRQGTLERVPTIAIRGKPLSQDVRPYANGIPFVLPLDQAREVLQLALQYAPIDLARESSDAQQAMIKQLEAQLAEVQDALVRSKRLYDTARANTTKLPELVQRAIFTNMISEALKQLTVDNAVIAKEYGENVAVSVIQRITLELVLGNVENANELLNSLSQPEQAAKLQNSGIAVVVQRLKFYKALFAGEFGLAGELWDSMAPPVGRFDKLPPLGPGLPEELVLAAIQAVAPGKDPKKAIANFLTPPLVFTPGHAQLTQYRLWMGPWYSMATGLQQAVSDQLTNEIEFYHRRGVLFLLQGDVAAAQERFRLCARTAPQGWGVPEHRHPGADMYLDLMKRASEKKPAAP
jgi:tetratricopeptide (TPR) repeat protein